MLRLAFRCLCLSLAGLLAAPVAQAQDAGRETVVPQENVRFDYAQVLEVNPIYQTLRATRMERVCDTRQPSGGGLSKVVSAVKDRLTGTTTREEREAGLSNCRMAPVVREYRRPIAFDVDYVYKGSKFRTRLAQDPGNRLRVRVSITPQPMAEP
ncbi:hypothetical protein [Thermomonas aquatica]|jgi:uncharacterized protein YcfJ|uniref:Uncharacterized protein n=1 Tax=Thermomonas aquatica TaxID=2202149 RepID=A0A5B7ZP15_9GAMM|nr:hypothetical protein [Thermomonas aquatica]QDA56283.1 hypothetical protein FHQ07_02600 [Thermomonas aquatica]